MDFDPNIALQSNAWPFKEASSLARRLEKSAKDTVIFETGYGPSGLPHIGTFGEVFRTTLVRRAFERLTGKKTRLIAFSDDMDGLRKVPDNVPNKEMLSIHLDKPLTSVPDPFGTHPSFGEHNNNRLKAFLDRFGFEYDFHSATDCYKNGKFNETLKKVLEHHDAIASIVGKTLDKERVSSKTYSPFLPRNDEGKWFSPKFLEADVVKGVIRWDTSEYWNHHERMLVKNPAGKIIETSIYDGNCKLQWRVDWAMRWAALGIDYEMHGKDLIPSAELATEICKIIGGKAPLLFRYELFLDEKGEKISKSKGNGISLENWLNYGTEESLSLFMYNKPETAKRLYFDVIPKNVDEYFQYVSGYAKQEPKLRYANPAFHLHNGKVPEKIPPISFSLLINLASACNPDNPDVLWGFISRYAPGATPETEKELAHLVQYALRYYQDFALPAKQFRKATEQEFKAMTELRSKLLTLKEDATAEEIQTEVYTVGKENGFENLREWFGTLYEVLLGSKEGPRMGSFIALYGIKETAALIETSLKR